MASLSEILIIRGLVPITSLDTVTGDASADDAHVLELVQGGVLTESQVASARAAQLGLPFVDLTEYPVDRSAVSLVPLALLRRHNVLPIGREGDRLLLAMADPQDVLALDDVRANVRMQVRPVVAERSDLLQAVSRFVRSDGELSDLTSAIVEESAATSNALVVANEATEDDAPIVRFVNLLISQAIQDHASDIHIEPAEHDVHVRYRIDGVLHEMKRRRRTSRTASISRLKIMTDIDHRRAAHAAGRSHVGHARRPTDRPACRDPPDRCTARRSSCVSSTTEHELGMEKLDLLRAQREPSTRRPTRSPTA